MHTAFSMSVVDGDDIVLGIPIVPIIPSEFQLIIGNSANETSYIIEDSTGSGGDDVTTSGTPASFILPVDLEVTSSEFAERMKGIRVRGTGENPIYVLVNIRFPTIGSVYGYATYLLHLNSEVENLDYYEYFAMSTAYEDLNVAKITNRSSVILLVGNFPATAISITPTQEVSLPEDAQTNSSLVSVQAGTTHQVTLDDLQTLLVSSLSDLTGTRIVSNKPLTVITGHQCAQVPSTVAFCEPLYVHVPPTFSWGRQFYLAPFAGRNSTQYYKLVTSKNSTTVAHRCGLSNSQEMEISAAGNSSLLEIPPGSFCFLTATSPIFVVQMAAGSQVDNMGDPAIAIVSPVSGHVNSTSFFSLPLFTSNFITVTVQAEHYNTEEILLDENQLDRAWNAIYHITSGDIVGYGCTASVSAGTHIVSHSGESGVLSVTAYGWDDSPAIGYAYLTGINLEGIIMSAIPSLVLL